MFVPCFAPFMKDFIIFLVFSTTFSTFSFSQHHRISGNVRNMEKTPVVYANVLLLRPTDSTVVKGTSTDEKGFFTIDNVFPDIYLITASYLGNEAKYLPIEVSSDTDIGTIVMDNNAQALDEVIVTSQKPRLERKVDRLVFNIANTALSEGNIWDVLKRTPNVVVLQNELTIKGSNNIGVMINDRKVNLPQEDIINLLSGTSAANVEAIEVITNPPAKYSAEGGMLLNIKMGKNLVAGYNGAVYNRFTQGVFAKHTLGTDHYFKGKKTGFSINYSFSNNKEVTRYTDVINFTENDTTTSVWTADQDYIRRRKRHNVSAFFDYEIDGRNALSVSSINVFNPSVDRFYDTETLIADSNGTLLSSFNTINDSEEDQLNTSVYLDWIHQLKKKGAELSINSHYTFYDYDRGQALETDFLDVSGNPIGENNFTTRSQQRINLYSVQADYTSPLGKSSRIETGLRYAGIASKSTITQQGFDRDQPGINPTEAGIFTYDEDIYAAYASFDGTWDTWKFKSGLRAEYTETTGDLDIAEEQNRNDYLELFPSFSLQYTPNNKHDYTLYYYRRITRPRYNNINPFQYFQNNNSVVEGNPDLLPATRNYIAAGYTFDQSYTVELFYKNQKNQFRQQVFQDNEANLLRFISANLDTNLSYGIDLSLNKDLTKFWYCYFLFSYFYGEDSFVDLDSGQLVDNGLWTYFMRINNSFTILNDKSLLVDLDFNYYSPIIIGNSRQESYNELGISLRKTLWDKKASISIGLADIFNQGNLFNTRRFLNQDNTSSFRPENRLFTLGLRYKFGNLNIRNNKKSKNVEERRRL